MENWEIRRSMGGTGIGLILCRKIGEFDWDKKDKKHESRFVDLMTQDIFDIHSMSGNVYGLFEVFLNITVVDNNFFQNTENSKIRLFFCLKLFFW